MVVDIFGALLDSAKVVEGVGVEVEAVVVEWELVEREVVVEVECEVIVEVECEVVVEVECEVVVEVECEVVVEVECEVVVGLVVVVEDVVREVEVEV